MNRVALAVFAVVMAVAVLVLITRQSGPEKPVPNLDAALLFEAGEEDDWDAGEDLLVDVKELALGDGATNQQSVRDDHPDQTVQKKLRGWLEPRETAAVTTGAAINCSALVAKTTLISITCSTLADTPAPDPDAGTRADGGGDSGTTVAVKYESLTIRIVRGRVKELALRDVLMPDAGEAEVMAACKKSADPPLPCVWPPTSFAVSPGGTLFFCHDSHCVDIDGESELLRPELR